MKVEMDAKGILHIDMSEVIATMVSNTPDDKLDDLIAMFAFQPRMFKFVATQLADEFVRCHYNEYIHEGREEFLRKVKDEEVKYYASKIADAMANAVRFEKAWLDITTWCRNNKVLAMSEFPRRLLDYPHVDVSFERHMEEVIAEAFKKNLAKPEEAPTA